jgi:hypothetical protein
MNPSPFPPPGLPRALALAGWLCLAACGSDGNSNPPVLWLGLDGSEIKVRLIEQEPLPY